MGFDILDQFDEEEKKKTVGEFDILDQFDPQDTAFAKLDEVDAPQDMQPEFGNIATGVGEMPVDNMMGGEIPELDLRASHQFTEPRDYSVMSGIEKHSGDAYDHVEGLANSIGYSLAGTPESKLRFFRAATPSAQLSKDKQTIQWLDHEGIEHHAPINIEGMSREDIRNLGATMGLEVVGTAAGVGMLSKVKHVKDGAKIIARAKDFMNKHKSVKGLAYG